MSKFNLGNCLNDNMFSKKEFKDITDTIGNVGGKFINYSQTMLTNMMKMSQNLSSFMSTSYFPYIILGIGGSIVLFKLKIILKKIFKNNVYLLYIYNEYFE